MILHRWQIEEIKKAVIKAEAGDFVSDEEMEALFGEVAAMSEKFCKPTPERQQLLKEELGRQFRIIWEESACSLWAYKIEDELPPLLIEGAAKQQTVNYQGVEISPVYSEWLVSLATEVGHWVNQGRSRRYIQYVPKTLRDSSVE